MDHPAKSLAGLNMGSLQLDDSHLRLTYSNQEILGVPLNKIVNSSVINKNDINLELAMPDHQEGDSVSCIRLYVPPSQDRIEEEGVEEELEQARRLNQQIVRTANIRNVSGDSLVTISEVPLQVPRGRYTVDIYENFLKFHGSTFNYKIESKHIERALLLPKPDDVHMVFVLVLKQSVRQGNTTYPYILMQFKKDQVQDVTLKMKPADYSKYDDSLESSYNGPLYDTFTKLFKILLKINIIIPGNFQSSSGHSAVRCSIRANEGFLFFLQKSLIFINKPIIYIMVEQIELAEFHRTTHSTSKFFDLTLKRRGRNQNDILLFGIDKKELTEITSYLKARDIKTMVMDQKDMTHNQADESDDDDAPLKQGEDSHLDEDSEDDESFNADDHKGASDSEDDYHDDTDE